MHADLFSSLDCGIIGAMSSLLWLLPLLMVLALSSPSSWFITQPAGLKYSINMYSHTSMKKMFPLQVFLVTLMSYLILMNLAGLIPFVYGATSSLWFAGSMALLLWMLLILSGWQRSPMESAAHLAPSGAPAALLPVLVLIETVSILIRPLTLTVRLIANISAGHIVMSLIANTLVSSGVLSMVSIFAVNVGYEMFEVFVCFIQAYIFTLLVKLYAEEHP
uniref:ATP synthase subunit a n=1 Tax=Pupa strigosa TaxID=96460 RepID=Q9T9G0_9GAST|nr:ATP synthase F0 subunit 6 [Pupa strigosa]BAA89023.1 ATPase6 [Pupa strigosa]